MSGSVKAPWRWTRRSMYWLAGIFIFLVIVRLAMPYALKTYVNHQLNQPGDYGGQIGDVTVHLWRGAYQVHDIHILKTDGKVPVPFFSTRILDLSLQWSELFHGALVSKIQMEEPSLNFVSGPTKEQTQTGNDNDWGKMLESLVPFDINRLAITNGQIHFQNLYSKPPVDIYVNDVSVLATNFSNSRKITAQLPAGITAQGNTLGKGGLSFDVHVDPLASSPTFEMTGQLTNVDLPALNDFIKAYGKFDVARGNFAIYTSFAAKDGKYDGYCKVFFDHLQVFKWEKDKKKDALEIFWQAIVGTLTATFKNHSHDQLATKIPITGAFDKTDVHIWPTIATLLQNAFFKSLVPKVDEPATLEKVASDATPPAATPAAK